MQITRWIALISLEAFVVQAWGQAATDERLEAQQLGPLTDEEFRLPIDPATEAEVTRLLPLLNAPSFTEREQATQRLLDIGAPAFAKLREAYHQAEYLEERLRIEKVVRSAYVNYHVLDRNGFLGVSMDTSMQRPVKGPNSTESETGLRIGQVTADTGAARAGLRSGDVILALNGKPFQSGENDQFSQSIRQFRPGTVVRLTILRDSQRLTIEPTLGRCPEEVLKRSRVLFRDDYLKAAERFPEWWYKYFAPANPTAGRQR